MSWGISREAANRWKDHFLKFKFRENFELFQKFLVTSAKKERSSGFQS